tara:strand:+ start:1427 stop:1630 length:204 start_codon:yes stop_codon:yes gene_type:complete
MWFCNTEEAKKQMEICNANNCPDCEKCIWITESSNAMAEYGTVIEPIKERHPLYDEIVEKFNGKEID